MCAVLNHDENMWNVGEAVLPQQDIVDMKSLPHPPAMSQTYSAKYNILFVECYFYRICP